MERQDRQQVVLDILKNLRGLGPLKELFWSQLSYQRINQPLPRQGWTATAAEALAEDPLLFAAGGEDNDFRVIYARLASEKLPFGLERPVVSRLLRDHPYALFVFSNSGQDRWHFLNVKYDDDVQRRRLYRRITIGPEERLRTASERIDKINLADARDHAPLSIQELHDDAFDVEPVTKEFFREYGRIFNEVEAAVKGISNPERKRLFVQRLFNRLMFIAFIQKKGWLRLGNNTHYLSGLWTAYQRETTDPDGNFYRDRLKPLFFQGLSTSHEVDIIGINRGGFLKMLIGEVPYLNGGLFEEEEEDKQATILVPDRAINAILNDLFDRFNFTVTESTPLDVEVAVDPEMLGKIFEELVTGRHETGSYYTPKPIVAFMCREALKGYLEAQLPTESKDAIEDFVDDHNPAHLRDAEAVLESLRRVKVCDPACGSGAYLVGMLHELLDLRACLFVTRNLDSKSVYDQKLEMIQNNLYGVDLDQFAVNIARLRLWLSLSVEYEGPKPPPLPNLDYKVEAGESICSPNPSGGLEMGFRKALIEEYLKAKAEYMTAHHERKRQLRDTVKKLRADIASWAHRSASGFDWAIEFAEVFVEGGFNVVLANPPYVRQELITNLKPVLERLYPDVYDGRGDLYCYFYARSLEALRRDGMLTFISSNKWFRSKYGAKLRKHISELCEVFSITDFGELPVFEAAATFPMIFVARRRQVSTQAPTYTQVRSLEPPYPDVKALIQQQGTRLTSNAMSGPNWVLVGASESETIAKMQRAGVPLREYANSTIYSGIKTGLNAAFWIPTEVADELIAADRRSREVIKKLARGDDVRQWHIRGSRLFIIYTHAGTDLNDYPAIRKYLSHFRSKLEQRAVQQPWWQLQQAQYRGGIWDRPKIVYPDICKESRFTLDSAGIYTDMKAFILPSEDLYLLGVLNSKPVWWFLQQICAVLGDPAAGGRLQLKRQYVERIPVPRPTELDRMRIEELVVHCLKRRGRDCAEYERELNERIASLYGLTKADLELVAPILKGNRRGVTA